MKVAVPSLVACRLDDCVSQESKMRGTSSGSSTATAPTRDGYLKTPFRPHGRRTANGSTTPVRGPAAPVSRRSDLQTRSWRSSDAATPSSHCLARTAHYSLRAPLWRRVAASTASSAKPALREQSRHDVVGADRRQADCLRFTLVRAVGALGRWALGGAGAHEPRDDKSLENVDGQWEAAASDRFQSGDLDRSTSHVESG